MALGVGSTPAQPLIWVLNQAVQTQAPFELISILRTMASPSLCYLYLNNVYENRKEGSSASQGDQASCVEVPGFVDQQEVALAWRSLGLDR